MRPFALLGATLVMALGPPGTSVAQGQPNPGDSGLAAQLANPVAALINVPFQNNLDFGGGRGNALNYTLNVQPVIPFELNDNWNLITRTIVPLRYSERIFPDHSFGLGDTVQSFFFSPRPVDGLTWAVGPVFLYPTGTETYGGRQWAAGPTGLALKQSGPWLYGVLANHLWSLGGTPDSQQPTNATFVQPFVTYVFPSQTSLFLNTESTYDWSRQQWTVPINAGVAQVVNFGGQAVQFSLGARSYAEAPEGAPDWGVRFGVNFVFPR